MLVQASCGRVEPPGETYEVLGFVVEAVDSDRRGPPIAGATVSLSMDTGQRVEGTTDSSGRYRLRIVSDTRFGELRASASGFASARSTVFFDSASRRVDLALGRAGL